MGHWYLPPRAGSIESIERTDQIVWLMGPVPMVLHVRNRLSVVYYGSTYANINFYEYDRLIQVGLWCLARCREYDGFQ